HPLDCSLKSFQNEFRSRLTARMQAGSYLSDPVRYWLRCGDHRSRVRPAAPSTTLVVPQTSHAAATHPATEKRSPLFSLAVIGNPMVKQISFHSLSNMSE